MSNDNPQPLNSGKPDSIDFSLPIDNSSFPMDKFNEMQKSRENELKQLETEKIKKENPQPKVNKSDEEITPSGIINQKNMILAFREHCIMRFTIKVLNFLPKI